MKKKRQKMLRREKPIIKILIVGIGLLAMAMSISLYIMSSMLENISNTTAYEMNNFYLKELAQQRSMTIRESVERVEEQMESVLISFSQQQQQRQINSLESVQENMANLQDIYHLDFFALVDESGMIYTAESTFSGITRFSFINGDLSEKQLTTSTSFGKNTLMIVTLPVKNLEIVGRNFTACLSGININDVLSDYMGNDNGSETICAVFTKNGEQLTSASYKSYKMDDNYLEYLEKNAIFDDGKSLSIIKEDIAQNREGLSAFMVNNGQYYLYYKPIEGTEWVLGVLIGDSAIQMSITQVKIGMQKASTIQTGMTVVTFSLFFLMLLLAVWGRVKAVEQASCTDILTGLWNRRKFNDYQTEMAARDGGVSVLFCDINRLKYINDHFGHSKGDNYIRFVADCLKMCFDGSLVFRLSGDEFAVCCSKNEELISQQRIKELRKICVYEGIPALSVGYAERASAAELGDALDEAEDQMYHDKSSFYNKYSEYRR